MMTPFRVAAAHGLPSGTGAISAAARQRRTPAGAAEAGDAIAAAKYGVFDGRPGAEEP